LVSAEDAIIHCRAAWLFEISLSQAATLFSTPAGMQFETMMLCQQVVGAWSDACLLWSTGWWQRSTVVVRVCSLTLHSLFV